MRYRKLGNTGLSVSEIGFGTIPILSGNVPVLPEYFSPDTDEAVRIMEHSFKLGCNLSRVFLSFLRKCVYFLIYVELTVWRTLG